MKLFRPIVSCIVVGVAFAGLPSCGGGGGGGGGGGFFTPLSGAGILDGLGQTSSGVMDFTSGMPNSGTSGFSSPEACALDTVHHRLFVTDRDNRRVLVYPLTTGNDLLSRTPTAALGGPGLENNWPLTGPSTFRAPNALAYDPVNDRLFVADDQDNRVLVFTTATLVDGSDAAVVIGHGDFFSQTAGAGPAGLTNPDGLAYDSTNARLFVTDRANKRVLVFDADPTRLRNGMNATLVIGMPDVNTLSITGPFSGSTFVSPAGLAMDVPGQRLFVTDMTDRRVLVFDVDPTRLVNGPAAINVLGEPDFFTFTGTTSPAGSLLMPFAASFGSDGRLLVVDAQDRVVVFDARTSAIQNGMNASFVLGQPDFTSSLFTATTRRTFGLASGVAYDGATKRAFVTDSHANRVLEFDLTATTNQPDAIDGLGHLDASGAMIYTRAYANDTLGPAGFYGPTAVALDPNQHRLFVADVGNNRILVFQLSPNDDLVGQDHSAKLVLGQRAFDTSDPLNIGAPPLSASSLFAPAGLYYEVAHDRLFVADTSNRRVLVFDGRNMSSGMSASFVLGQTDFTSNLFAVDQRSFGGLAFDVIVDEVGQRLFVADGLDNRVLVFDVDPTRIRNGEDAVAVIGQPDFTSSTSGTGPARLSFPDALAFDAASQRLFVADFNNGRVLGFDVATVANGMSATLVIGKPDFTSTGPSITRSGLSNPGACTWDPIRSTLYVSDSTANRVFAYTGPLQSAMPATAVLGQVDFVSSSPACTQVGLFFPSGLFTTPEGGLWITDNGNNRVLLANFP